ncbi:FHA domain-containing protein [Paludibaculum fermentans]|uniref:FHA domain-containing protein n=1 Tax=Paludibaculum fermentans TaxID=1473598 RepID=A0A7S7NT87_PALFE|nr:FHA domain-containing protein [Paludibaculum fermentans]QOY89284.1 FHA domain-containing protein [Paludibaculum fermentans]
MTQCNSGHFYDETKFSACPYCPAIGAAPAGKTVPAPPGGGGAMPFTVPPSGATAPPIGGTGPESNKTVPMRPLDAGLPSVPSAPLGPAGGQKTVVAYPSFNAPAEAPVPVSPVVGWLVCTEGPSRGRDYRLHVAKNFVGREKTMDVCVEGDPEVSRERHAEVIFEPQTKTFWLKPGDSSGLVYLNGTIQFSPVQMNARDVLTLGKSKLMLVPLVGTDFDWN